MDRHIDSSKVFQIIFNNRIIQISYDSSFPEFKNQTVGSLIFDFPQFWYSLNLVI